MQNKLMLDTESLGLGNCPIILSMGAVVFDETSIHAHFEAAINIQSCRDAGFSSDESTILWWGAQDENARRLAFSGEEDIKQALINLVNFYISNECTEIWSKGSLADIRWINNALDHFGIERPWKFYQEMCFRTLLKSVSAFEMSFKGVPHVALDDAIHQARQFIQIKKMQNTKTQHLIQQGQNINALHEEIRDLKHKLAAKEQSHDFSN